ncbi:unnamed protein product, partial [Cuscuta epithymum]
MKDDDVVDMHEETEDGVVQNEGENLTNKDGVVENEDVGIEKKDANVESDDSGVNKEANAKTEDSKEETENAGGVPVDKNEKEMQEKNTEEEQEACDMPTFNILTQSQGSEKKKEDTVKMQEEGLSAQENKNDTAESGWGMGSQDNSQFILEMCKSADEVAKKAFESYSSNPCRAIIVKPDQEDLPKQKRFARSPVKYTPSEHSAKRRKREKGKKRADDEFLPPLKEVVGPFTEDPTESPPDHEIERVREYLKVGLLKKFQKSKNPRRYTMDEDKMIQKPFLLDCMKVESKTWLYDMFMNHEWITDKVH